MSNSKIQAIKKELEIIREKNGGILTPDAVVKFAKNKKSVLHGEFVWDNDEAANKYRLTQAMLIIRTIKVEIRPNPGSDRTVSIRAYVSLPSDRGSEGVYRPIIEVMSDKEQRIEFIQLVQSELAAFQKKLQAVSEVAAKKMTAVEKEVAKQLKIARQEARP
jgi:hypothetical protein